MNETGQTRKPVEVMERTGKPVEDTEWTGKPVEDTEREPVEDTKQVHDPVDRGEAGRNPNPVKIQWHPGFRDAFRREFRPYWDCMIFEEERPLTISSLFVDLLIIEVTRPVSMENELGKIFRRYNLCEYKGPGDGLTIDDYYKAVACGCLYKSSGQTVDERPAREITISLIRDTRPEGLFQNLLENGYTIAERYPGVFYLGYSGGDGIGGVPFPTQVIVTGDLRRETHSGLRFLTEAQRELEPGDRAIINTILTASMAANMDLFRKIGREKEMYYPALRELMKEDLEEERKKGRMEGRMEGHEEGIFNLIGAYRDEFGLDNAAITERLAKRYHLTKEQAAHYVAAPGA